MSESRRSRCWRRVSSPTVVALAVLCVGIVAGLPEPLAQGRVVRLWLMPQEPAIDNPGATAARCGPQVLPALDVPYGQARWINILNASEPGLRSSWDAINPEFATTNVAMVTGQCRTLMALE